LLFLLPAAESERLWKAVPGHKNILVDMASIKPLDQPPPSPRTDGVKFWDTEVAITVNGTFSDHYWMDCVPRVTHTPGDNEIHLENGRIIRVPAEVVEDLVCPVRNQQIRSKTSN
jgi:hypothetical protein